jgi:outer membrane protein OmpA-like peptidoglycan-associated protein
MKKLVPILFLFFSSFGQKTQPLIKKTAVPDSVFPDCGIAHTVILNGPKRIGPTLTPTGPGISNELLQKKQGSKFIFDQEHNTAWYKLIIGFTGELCFNIIPLDKHDDYDFILFKAGPYFCDSLDKNKISPLRACISRNDTAIKSMTGLSVNGKKELVKEGRGDSYVKPLRVTKGEEYYLILDNVYPEGKGHSIYFYYGETIEISGVVKDEKERPVKAEVAVTNDRGDTIMVTHSKKDGFYKLKAFLSPNTNYGLNFYNDSSFVYSKSFTLKDTAGLRKLKTVLPKLNKGKKYSIGTINFYPGSDTYLPVSLPAIRNLARLMSKNDSLKILIIGHTNGSGGGTMELSKARAEAIQFHLYRHKIAKQRVQVKGMGGQELLYPVTGSEWEQEQNRRVEIMVLSY